MSDLNPKLFDESTRPRQHLRRYPQADLLGGLEIDDKLELHRLLDRKFAGWGAFQNPVHKIRHAPVAVRFVRPVLHKPTGIYIFTSEVHRRQPAL